MRKVSNYQAFLNLINYYVVTGQLEGGGAYPEIGECSDEPEEAILMTKCWDARRGRRVGPRRTRGTNRRRLSVENQWHHINS